MPLLENQAIKRCGGRLFGLLFFPRSKLLTFRKLTLIGRYGGHLAGLGIREKGEIQLSCSRCKISIGPRDDQQRNAYPISDFEEQTQRHGMT